MLSKALLQNRSSLRLMQQAQRSIITVPGKQYVVPESVNDVIQHLDSTRPTYTLLYFTASWNPMCAKIEKDYENLTSQYPQFHHIRVDCDATPKLKFYFDARVEPQFLILVNGGEISRTIGYNFQKIGATLEKVQDLHQRDLTYFGNSKDTWERFYDAFDRWAKVGEYDRDSFRPSNESQSDTHRGVGSI